MTDKPEPIKKRTDLSSIPTKQYIDQTVAPILLGNVLHTVFYRLIEFFNVSNISILAFYSIVISEGLKALAKERPPDPIGYLADYLLKHKSNNGEQHREETTESEQN